MLDLELDTRSKKQISRVFQVQRSSSSPLYRIIYTKQSFFSSSIERTSINKWIELEKSKTIRRIRSILCRKPSRQISHRSPCSTSRGVLPPSGIINHYVDGSRTRLKLPRFPRRHLLERNWIAIPDPRAWQYRHWNLLVAIYQSHSLFAGVVYRITATRSID